MVITEGSIRPQVKGLFLKKKNCKESEGPLKFIVKMTILGNKRLYMRCLMVYNYPLPANREIPNHSKSYQNVPF